MTIRPYFVSVNKTLFMVTARNKLSALRQVRRSIRGGFKGKRVTIRRGAPRH